MDFYLGIDIGSVSINVSVLNTSRQVIIDEYHRIKGRHLELILSIFENLFRKIPQENFKFISFTGTGAKTASKLTTENYVNEIILGNYNINSLWGGWIYNIIKCLIGYKWEIKNIIIQKES